MKRLRLLPLILALLLCGCAAKEGAPDPVPEESPAVREEAPAEQADFLSITGLDRMAEALEAGATLIGAEYTDGYGFSESGFSTVVPEELAALWSALRAVELAGETGESVTDWYPSIAFRLSDGSAYTVRFEAHWLCVGTVNYRLSGDEAFWRLCAVLSNRAASHAPDEGASFTPNAVDLYLPSNPSTGYGWWAEAADEGIVEIQDLFFADGFQSMPGAGGVHWFHFKGLKEGTTHVRLCYSRPWESVQPLHTYVYRLSVDKDLNVLIWGVEVDPLGAPGVG